MLLLLAACRSVEGVSPDPVEEPVTPFPSICPTAGGAAEELALWRTDGAALSFVRLDGTVVEGHDFFADLGHEDAIQSGSEVVATEEWIAASGVLYLPDAEAPYLATELVLFDRVGTVQWTWREEGVYSRALYLGDEGTVAWDRGWEGFDASNARMGGRVFSPGGDTAELDGWPVGTPSDGLVPRCDGIDCSWDDPFTGSVENVRYDIGTWTRDTGDYVVWPVGGQGVVLVVEDASGSRSVPLEGASDVDALEIANVTDGWLLATEGDLTWRVDLAGGVAERVAPTPPAGLRPFEDADYCAALPPTLDDEGNVLMALRDDTRGALWRTDPAGSRWEQVGLDVTDALWLTGGGVGGSYMARATHANETYCPALPWTSDPDALAGSSLQLIRGDRAFTFDPWSGSAELPFSPDGACALLMDGEVPTVLDMGTGARAEVPGAWGWVRGG